MIKRNILITIVLLTVAIVWGQTTIVNENIQSWTNHASYGSYTQQITVGAGTGNVSMTQCIVANAAAATGTCSAGRIQLQASAGIVELPSLPSVGRVEFHFAAGAADRTIALQTYNGSAWVAVTSFTGIGTTGATFSYNVNSLTSTVLRLATPSAAIYLYDIIITDYTGSSPTLATVSTAAITAITSSSAICGGNVTSDGGSSVSARGVCWNTSSSPTISNSFTTNGSGTGSFVSNLSSLAAETLYYVRAYATNAQGTAYGEEYSFSTSGNSPPATPVATTATNVGVNSFTANWNAATGATSYRLDVATNSSFTSILSSYNNLTVATTSQSVSGLTANTPYYYRVRAYNSYGTSGNSNTISTTTLAGDPFNGYYNPVAGLSGTALKTGLHNLIDNNTYSSYDGAKLVLFQELDNVGGVVRCVYTGRDYTINSSYNGSSDPNTEHSYAQSWFGTSETSIKAADVHHLFITNSSVNSSRGNLPFGVVTGTATTYPSYNGYVSKRGSNSTGQTVFEPADQHKGNLARALLYFNVRYDMTLSQGGVDMLETLLTWHNADPVDAAELTRNTAVYNHQGNRNPFVDHPEYVASIWGGSTASTLVQFSPASALVNEASGTVTVSVQIANPSSTTATTAQIALTDGSASDVGNFSTRSITFPAGSSTSQSISVTITDDSLLEGTETLIFSLINVSGGNSASIGNYGSFNLEIEDNDIPAPVATAATAVGYTGFTANWNAASGISDYEFDLSTSPTFTSFVGAYENYPLSATSLPITGLTEGSTYYYRVKAIYNSSAGLYSNVITTTTSAIIYLDTPVATTATAVSHEGFTARWNAVTGADSYRLDVFSGGSATATDLFISEYVEGSSNNKYLEIFNGTGDAVDLSNYQLKLYSNGATSASYTLTLSGILANGACAVYRNSSAVLVLPEGVTATSSTVTNYNGNDAVELYKISPAGSVDIFGRIGDSTVWTAGSISAVDQTLRRKSTVLSGVSTNPATGFPTLATEWDSYPMDTSDGLGSHSIGASSPVSGYTDLAVSSNVARVSGLNPQTDYSYRVRAVNIGDTSDNSNTIQVSTTTIVEGTGANTLIEGSTTTVLLPVLPGFSNNDVIITPSVNVVEDISVTTSSLTAGISYTFNCADNSALNGDYTFFHEGLGFSPQGVQYTLDGNTFTPATFSSTLTQTQFILSGLAKGTKGILEVILTQDATLPVELSSFTATINTYNKVTLQWISQSESGLLGYYILRCPVSDLTSAIVISPLINATNTSQQQCYLYTDSDLDQDGMLYYWLQNLDMDGGNNFYGPISIYFSASGGDSDTPIVPQKTGITSIYPNPFSEQVSFAYSLSKSNAVSFTIFNSKGQRVKSIPLPAKEIGFYNYKWNGKDDTGRNCGTGIYFIKMQSGTTAETRKAVILR